MMLRFSNTKSSMLYNLLSDFVTTQKRTYDKYDWRVTSQNHTKSTNHLPNTITMVVEPPTPAAAWIWWTHAARGVGVLAHARSDAAIEAI